MTEITIEETVVIKTGKRGYWQGSHYISTGFTGHWTKWGGAVKDVVQENLSEEWYCQSCGELQPAILTPLKYEFPVNEFIRVCSYCFHNDCPRLK